MVLDVEGFFLPPVSVKAQMIETLSTDNGNRSGRGHWENPIHPMPGFSFGTCPLPNASVKPVGRVEIVD